MADVNTVILIGRLTRDAELKYTSGGFAIGTFSLAVNRRRKNGDQWTEEVSFFEINLYGKTAESLNQYLIKGKQVAVEGELRQDRWEQDGQSRSKIVIVANNIQLLGGGAGGSANQNTGYSNTSGGAYTGTSNNSQQKTSGGNSGYYQPKQNHADFDAGQSYGSDNAFPEDIPF